jgi:radical SAM-linked protein
MDMELSGDCSASLVMDGLNNVLPAGIKIVSAEEIPLKSPSLSVIIDSVRYRVTSEALVGIDLAVKAREFLALESFPWRREKRGKVVELDLRAELREVVADGYSVELLVARGKPLEFVAAIMGVPLEQLAESRIEKLEVVFASGQQWHT